MNAPPVGGDASGQGRLGNSGVDLRERPNSNGVHLRVR